MSEVRSAAVLCKHGRLPFLDTRVKGFVLGCSMAYEPCGQTSECATFEAACAEWLTLLTISSLEGK